MATPFDHWNARIGAADELASRKALMTEISYWRATRLTDIRVQRESAYALARLFALIGDNESALREAHSLIALCQSAPEASDEEVKLAVGFLHTLGGRSVVAPGKLKRREDPRSERPARDARPAREPKPDRDPLEEALAQAAQKRWDAALKFLKPGVSPRMELVRTWVVLARALDEVDGVRRAQDIAGLEAHLRTTLLAKLADAKPAKAEKNQTKAAASDGPATRALAEWLGAVPAGRDDRITAIEAAIETHGDRLDGLAARALDHHLEAEGAKAPAPWLIGLVAQALAADAPETKAAIDRLKAVESYAITAYGEWPFAHAVAAIQLAKSQGLKVASLRRGVLARGEPRDHKLWTLRLGGDEPSLLVLGGPWEEGYRPDTAARLADRLIELCPKLVLVAPGDGNAALREAATSRGITVLESDVPAEWLSALAAAVPLAAVEAAPPPPRRERAGDALGVLLSGAEAPEVEALEALIRKFPRVHKSFGVIREALAALSPEEADRRLAIALEAAHRAAPDRARLSEGATLALRSAAAVKGESAALKAVSGAMNERFGGPMFSELAEVAIAAIRLGFGLERVLRGSTGRERRDDPVLDALGDAADGLWRLQFSRGESEVELWFMAEVTPEGRAAVPRWLQHPAKRVVVAPVPADWLGWYETTGGPEAVGWTGPESVSDVVAELEKAGS